MSVWKIVIKYFFNTVDVPLFGAGFRKEGVEVSKHPKMITLDGHSVYFFRLKEKEASRLLDGVTMLNGLTGWLTYILQEIFYEDRFGEELYGEIFDGLYNGAIKSPAGLSRESIYNWLEEVAPQVEEIKKRLETNLTGGDAKFDRDI